MSTRALPSVIAVDGGGTRCRLLYDGPRGRHLVERGSANVSSDFDAAIAEMNAGLADLAGRAGLSLAELRALPAYLGLAGMTNEALGARVAAGLGLGHARVEEDRLCALRGALGRDDGAVAHFGTGSFFAFQHGGAVRVAGGWGSRLGDEGSAFWLARRALTATLEAVDRLIAPTDLTRALLDRFGAASEIVAFAAQATPAEVAELARLVTAAAGTGDAVGQAILRAAADHIVSVLGRMGWQPGMALCLTGGLGPTYRAVLPVALQAALTEPRATPVEGALELARDLAAELAR